MARGPAAATPRKNEPHGGGVPLRHRFRLAHVAAKDRVEHKAIASIVDEVGILWGGRRGRPLRIRANTRVALRGVRAGRPGYPRTLSRQALGAQLDSRRTLRLSQPRVNTRSAAFHCCSLHCSASAPPSLSPSFEMNVSRPILTPFADRKR